MAAVLVFYVISCLYQYYSDNTPPTMTGPSVLEITVGMNASYTFTVVDDDSFTVGLVNTPAGSQILPSGQTYTFQWTVSDIDDVIPLTFYARDSLDATTILSPTVEVCACQNNGECTSDGAVTMDNVATLNCLCSQGTLGIKIFCSHSILCHACIVCNMYRMEWKVLRGRCQWMCLH